MAITSNDIKLMKSERLSDDTDGGGRMSGNEVIDGLSNNLFPDIATLDRINGRVFLRKASAALLTDDTENLLGSHVIFTTMATDPNVSCTMFTTGSHTDERAAAKTYLEARRYSQGTAVVDSVTINPSAGTVTFSTVPPVVGAVYNLDDGFAGNDYVYIKSFTGTGPWVATVGAWTATISGSINAHLAVPAAGVYGISPLAVTVASGSVLTVDTVNERISPKYDGVDPAVIGFNPANLPDGRAPIFAAGYVVVLHNTIDETMPGGLTAGQVVALSRANLAQVRLIDQTGAYVATDKYTVDLVAGNVTMATPLDLSAYTQPLIARHRIEQMFRATAVNNATKEITIAGTVTRSFPATTSFVSSALNLNDLKARVLTVFDQTTWTNVWSDALIGEAAPATYNHVTYPIAVTNRGAIKERWRVEFTSSTAFKVVGENVGQIAVGNTSTETAPINPNNGAPYFILPALGWGTGWNSGNLLRFNTEAAAGPVWLDRCVNLGDPTATDLFTVEIRGDINV